MSKGYSGLFCGTNCDNNSKESENQGPINGTDYNKAGSSSVKKVDSIKVTNDSHSIPTHGDPNSVHQNYKDGELNSERYYDDEGNAYLDIDYTDHGNSKTHPNVPHEHSISFDDNGKMHREDEPNGGIKNE